MFFFFDHPIFLCIFQRSTFLGQLAAEKTFVTRKYGCAFLRAALAVTDFVLIILLFNI